MHTVNENEEIVTPRYGGGGGFIIDMKKRTA